MTVKDIMVKIDRIDKLINDLDELRDEHNLVSNESLIIEDAQDLLGEYLEELGKKKVE